jgi:hypothetical protein
VALLVLLALTVSLVLRAGVSGFLVAALSRDREGNAEHRTDDHGQKRGIVGVYPTTYYATACLAIFSVARQKYSVRALAIGFVLLCTDYLDLHAG